MSLRTLALAAVVFLASVQASSAAPITYTLTGKAQGSLDGTPFDDADFQLIGIGDTNTLVTTVTGTQRVSLSSVTFELDGLGIVTITEGLRLFNNPTIDVSGFTRTDGSGDWLDVASPVFATYDNVSPLGPLAVDQHFSSDLIATSGGDLDITDLDDDTLIYTVTVGTPVDISEPGTLALTACGLAIILRLRRARRQA